MTYPRLSDRTAALAHEQHADALVQFKTLEYSYPDIDDLKAQAQRRGLAVVTRAAMSPVTAGDFDLGQERSGFAQLVRQASIVGRIQGATHVPVNGQGAYTTSTPTAYWTGQLVPIPSYSPTVENYMLEPTKIAALTVASDDATRRADVNVPRLIRSQLVAGLAAALDMALLDPASTAQAHIRPASLVAGQSAQLTGTVTEAVGAALHAVSMGAPLRPHVALSWAHAVTVPGLLRDLRDTGVEILITPGAGDEAVAFDAASLVLAVGAADVELSRAGLVILDDDPAHTGDPVSAWERNLVTFRGQLTANWIIAEGASAYATIA